jgi:hypothetical protein
LRGLGSGVRVCVWGWGLGGLGLGWAGLGCGGAGGRGCGSGLAASSGVSYLRSHLLQAGGCRRGGPKTCTPRPRGVPRAPKRSEHIVAFWGAAPPFLRPLSSPSVSPVFQKRPCLVIQDAICSVPLHNGLFISRCGEHEQGRAGETTSRGVPAVPQAMERAAPDLRDIYIYIPQTDLSVGVLTVLYKGPCLVRGSRAKTGEHFSL